MEVFHDLLQNFRRDLGLAASLSSPNREDSLEIKLAIVGFSYECATQEWNIDEYEFVGQRLDTCEGYSGVERLFYSLAIGRLLGLASSRKVNRQEFGILMAQLPGFILMKAGSLEG